MSPAALCPPRVCARKAERAEILSSVLWCQIAARTPSHGLRVVTGESEPKATGTPAPINDRSVVVVEEVEKASVGPVAEELASAHGSTERLPVVPGVR